VIKRSPLKGTGIALTFDDGPNPKITPKILDILAEKEVPATFFVQGYLVATHNTLIQRIQSEGHELENHSFKHDHFDQLTASQAQEDLKQTQAILCDSIGKFPKYFRPPYGDYTPETQAIAASFGLTLLLWDVDTRDWSNRNAEIIVKRVKDLTKPGSIILLHDRVSATVEALPQIIDYLKEKDFSLVTLQDLLDPPELQLATYSYNSKNQYK
jgi:peptidoglycan/xylan/chitin deacetylase (PgdA/CDA1 family)